MRERLAWLRREPLFQFLAAGGVLFAVHATFGPAATPAADEDRVIRVSAAEVSAMADELLRTTGRPPTGAELDARVAARVREEVLEREARAAGLDRTDGIVRRRLVQKMELLLEGMVRVDTPADLPAPPAEDRMRVTQLFFDRGRGDARERAEAALATLREGAEPAGIGDAFAHGRSLVGARGALAARLGDPVADALASAPVGAWTGPVEGPFGVHLVRVESRGPDADGALALRRAEAARERRREAVQAAVDALVAGYEVEVEPRPTAQMAEAR